MHISSEKKYVKLLFTYLIIYDYEFLAWSVILSIYNASHFEYLYLSVFFYQEWTKPSLQTNFLYILNLANDDTFVFVINLDSMHNGIEKKKYYWTFFVVQENMIDYV